MRYTKHHKTAEIARLPRAIIAGGASIVVLVAAFLVISAPQPSTRKALPEFSLPAPTTVLNPLAAANDKPVRLVYRNSVVPGGVHSAAELADVIARDPVAAAHYANFDVAKAHIVRVETSRMVHVSYRIGNQIYWTKNKVRLALGEALLSDGTHLIRARCGNRLADEAEGPTLLNEPAPEVLETAFVSAEDLIDQSVSMAAFDGAAPPAAFAGPGAATGAPVIQAGSSRSYAFDAFGPSGITRQPTSSGVTVLPPAAGGVNVVSSHAAPALPASGPADPATPATPADPADPIKPLLPGGTPGKGGINDPIEVHTDLPKPPSPEEPFIDPPIFTPPASTPGTPVVIGKTPEPSSAWLAGLALALMLVCSARRRR